MLFQDVALFLVFASLSHAAPWFDLRDGVPMIPLHESRALDRNVSIVLPLTQVRPNIKRADGSVDLDLLNEEVAWAQRKYKINLRRVEALREAAPETRLRERGQVALTMISNAVYSAPITVGTPPQTFSVYLDTGSSDLTLADISCSSPACGSRQRYNGAASSTSANSGQNVQTCYVDGSCTSGKSVSDIVTFTGNTASQTFISGTTLSTSLQFIATDGLMGMAYPALSATGSSSVPFSLYNSGASPIFSLYFSSVAGQSFATIGQPPKNRIQSNNFQRYFISKPNSYWQAPASLANVNGKVAVSARATHIYDCGTTLIIAPPSAAAEFWANVPGSAPLAGSSTYYTYPCANPPSISFTPSKFRTSYGVAEDDFNLGYVSSDPSRCVGAVVSVNVGLGSSWILGLAFLKNKVVVHNMQSGQIGFAVPRNF